ncbi:hypothetical protein SNE40_018634 [Patella caerulea]|uniref:DDB1- and CUL4-associated factor 6 n=1 Tax=Patella caerulea TaxID=87958 RepID=A0AAN8P896_PATCE
MFPSIQRRQYGLEKKSKLYDIARGVSFVQRLKLDKKLEVHAGCVNTICWSDSGEYILSGSDDQNLAITNPFTQKTIASIRSGHRANIFSARFLPNSRDRHVISCSGAGKIYFTEVNREDTYGKNRFDCHVGTTYEVITLPNEATTFLSCGEDGTVRLFDLRAKTSCSKENCKDDVMINCRQAVTSLAVDPIMPYHLAAACSDSSVRIFDRRMLGTRASGNYTGRGITGMISRFTAPLEHKAYRITSLNYSDRGHDVLVSYSSENIYLFCTMDERKPRVLKSRNTPEGDDRSAGQSSTSGDAASRQPPIKRLRLRGDWSDTGPNARPERERMQEESGNQSPHATLMQRMSEMLTRWLDGSLRRDDDPAVPPEGAVAAPVPGEPPLPNPNIEQPPLPPEPPVEILPPEPPSLDTNVESTLEESVDMEESCSRKTNDSVSSLNVEMCSLDNNLTDAKPSTSQNVAQNRVRPKSLYSLDESSTTSVFSSSPSTDEPVSTPSERSASTSDTVSSVKTGSISIEPDEKSASSGVDPDLELIDEGVTQTKTQDNNGIAGSQNNEINISKYDLNKKSQSQDAKSCDMECATTSDSSAIPKCLSSSTQTDNSQKLEPIINLHYSSQGTSASTISVGFASFDLTGTSTSAQARTDNSNSVPTDLPSTSAQTVAHTEATTVNNISDDATHCATNNSDNSCRGPSAFTGQEESLSEHTEASTSRTEVTEQIDSNTGSVTEQTTLLTTADLALPIASRLQDTIDSSEGMVTFTESESSTSGERLEQPNRRTIQRPERRSISSSGIRHRRIGISGPPTGQREEEESSDEDILPRPIPRCRFFRDESDEERHIAAFKLQTAYRKRQEVREQQEMKDVYQPKTKRKYKGHRNARTMIKEANFWGDNFVMSGSDCGHIFIWDRQTGEVVMLLEADRHVVNCLQPHPFDPILASSGIDYDIKLWAPLEDQPIFDCEKAQEVIRRNEIMLEETRDTITVPAAFMLRVLASLNQIRAGRNVSARPEANREISSDSD